MMIAQAVAEYGLMEQMALGVQKTSYAVRGFISDAGPGTWVVVAVIVLGGLWSLGRRRSR
jgi:MYXO-CTERM domain-containing protein